MVNDALNFEFFDAVLGYNGRGMGVSTRGVGGVVIRMEGFEKGDMEDGVETREVRGKTQLVGGVGDGTLDREQ